MMLLLVAIICAPLTYWALAGKADQLILQHEDNDHRN